MGIVDKIKALFKKEDSDEKAKVVPKASTTKAPPASAAIKDYGDTQLGKALTFAEKKLAEKQDKLNKSELEMFRSKIALHAEKIGKNEDEALIQVSQLIGAITRA
ncbi:MAG: hypothetical protein PWQ88_91 [Candidatus Methanomethylophilaceae archaeon]|nr:hypothetical protein [Candidatus Methanomethylophilaceae archaeon]MDI3541768.1 hypothetical protein [Candidatus Methanomethylophilaceae archaeon]HIJ00078.1 hypothetical protein [Candidatus Methanomethylophilaceae archaeon]